MAQKEKGLEKRVPPTVSVEAQRMTSHALGGPSMLHLPAQSEGLEGARIVRGLSGGRDLQAWGGGSAAADLGSVQRRAEIPGAAQGRGSVGLPAARGHTDLAGSVPG